MAAMQVSPSVRAVQIPEFDPAHPRFTTIYLIGGDQALTIDSGADEERYRWMLRGYLAATEHAEIALCAVTHFHFDHSANLRWIGDEFGATVTITEATAARLEPHHLPEDGPTILKPDGVLDAGGPRLQVIPTPGHSPDSVCYFLEDEGVLFTGDTILGSSTTTVQDLAAYMESLSRLRNLPNLRVLCPGHGALIHDPFATLDGYIAHRQERERQIIEALSQEEALSSWQIMERLYPDVNPRLRRLADGNVRSHLGKLEAEGRLRVYPGKPRTIDQEAVAREEAEALARAEAMRQADEYREQAKRRAIFLQENPPDHLWLEPPRYDLI